VINEAWLREDPQYMIWKQIGQQLKERDLTKQEVLALFGNVEQAMTNRDTGANRTLLGRGKDITTKYAGKIKDATNKILGAVQDSVPVEAVDTYYNQATNALNRLVGGDKGKVMKAITAYRNLAKAYPKTAGFAKAALVAITGLATGGAGLPIIAGLTYGLDSAIKGDRLSTVLGKGGGAAALAWAGQQVAGALTGTPAPGTTEVPPEYAMGAGQTLTPPGEVPPEYAMGAGQTLTPPGEVAPEYAMGAGQTLTPPGEIPPEYAMGAGQTLPGAEGAAAAASEVTRYTVTAADAKGLGSIAQKFDITAQQLWDNNPQIADPNIIYVGQELNVPASTGEKVNVWDGWQGPTKKTITVEPTANTEIPEPPAAGGAEAGPGAADTAGRGAAIDYSQKGPVTTDSLGQKLEYGIPVNDKGAFVPPNPNLPAEELARQQAAYDAWKSDYMKRFPNAVQMPDGSMQGIKPGLAPMFPGGGKVTLPSVQEAIDRGIQNAQIIKLSVDKLIDQKFTVMHWALNESAGKPQGQSLYLTDTGVKTVFANIDRVGRSIVKELRGVARSMPGYLTPDLPGGPGRPVKPGLVGKGLNWLDKTAGKVGGFIKSKGHEFTTNVTKDKLEMKWQTAGSPNNSDQLARWLQTQKVPAEVVAQVYQQMGIPEPGQIGTDKSFAKIIKPGTDRYYTRKELDALQAKQGDTTTAAAAEPDAEPEAEPAAKSPAGAGAGAFGQMASQLTPSATGGRTTQTATGLKHTASASNLNQPTAATAAPAAPAAKPAAPAAKPTGVPGYDFKALTKMPGMEKLAQKKPDFSMPSAYGKTTYSMKPPAINTGAKKAAPAMAESQAFIRRTMSEVKQQLAQATTKEDVSRIKSYIDREFVRHGLVNESYQTMRDNMIRKVVTIGAQRRREAASR
jgi:LysM repeat protein